MNVFAKTKKQEKKKTKTNKVILKLSGVKNVNMKLKVTYAYKTCKDPQNLLKY